VQQSTSAPARKKDEMTPSERAALVAEKKIRGAGGKTSEKETKPGKKGEKSGSSTRKREATGKDHAAMFKSSSLSKGAENAKDARRRLGKF